MENMVINNILITGSDGYIGAVLADSLIKYGYFVTGLDTYFYKKNILGVYKPKFRSLHKDIRHVNEKDLESFDAVIHLAALSNDALSVLNPRLTEAINYKATVSLAKKAKKAGVKRFLFSSSCSIYGIATDDFVTEESKPKPLTPYALSKIKSEKALQKLADTDFFVCLLRNSTVYGYSPKFRNDLVVNNLLTSAFMFSEIRVHSDGTPWRPLIDVRDLSEIFIDFLQTTNSGVNGKIFNIGFSNNNLRVNDIIHQVHELLPSCKIVYTGKHGNDSRSYRVDFTQFQKHFPKRTMQYSVKKSMGELLKVYKKGYLKKSHVLNQKFERVNSLKDLLNQNRVTDELFWNLSV